MPPPRHVIAFAHRGGMAHRPANTLQAFRNARAMGSRAVETDAWLTRDGIVVLDHDGVVEVGGRTVAIADVNRDQLPPHIPTLAEYYVACGTDLHVSIDVQDSRAGPVIVEVARRAGGHALSHLWLVGDLDTLLACRRTAPEIHLVGGWDPRGADVHTRIVELASKRIDALNVRERHCTLLTAAACRRAGIKLFVWDVQDRRQARRAMRMGVDAVYGDNIDILGDAIIGAARHVA